MYRIFVVESIYLVSVYLLLKFFYYMKSTLHFNASSFDMEDFQTEIVLVNIESGIYYNLSGLAADLLRHLQNPIEESIITNWIQSLNSSTSKEGLEYLEWLINENIVLKTQSQSDSPDATSALKVDLSSDLWIYERFDDMSDLIRLDPIHDVSHKGWPHKRG
jgi:hypothetical protein